MYIGSVKIESRLALAPMAGVTDLAFRAVCREQGAGLTYTEMISARAMCYQDAKTLTLLKLGRDEHPCSVQVFGSEPEHVARAAVRAQEISGADIVDINMGCPTPKIVRNGDGGALLKDLPLAARIIESTVKSVRVPVTVKYRLGWDEDSIVALEFARMAQQAGASAVCLHARTCKQMYSGRADWDMIARVRQVLTIPLIANGDVSSPQAAVDMLDKTGADMVMIGRAAMGNPWIFACAAAFLSGKPMPPMPTLSARCDTAVRQFELAALDKGERVAVLEARKHYAWYLRGIRNAGVFRQRITQLSSMEEIHALTEEIKRELVTR